jgi:hypothetical protein
MITTFPSKFLLLLTFSFFLVGQNAYSIGNFREGYTNKESNFEILLCSGLKMNGQANQASDSWQIDESTGGQICLFLNSNISTYFNFDSIEVECYKINSANSKSELCRFWFKTERSKKPQVFPINFFNSGKFELMVYSNNKDFIGTRQFEIKYKPQPVSFKRGRS